MKVCVYSSRCFASRWSQTGMLMLLVLTGVFLGAKCGYDAGISFSSLVGSSITETVSTVRLLFSLLLPFLAASLAVIYSKPLLLMPICAMKAFCFSCCLAGVFRCFESGAWLAAAVLLASDSFSVFLLLGFSFRHISGFRHTAVPDLLRCVVFALWVGLLYCFYIAPFTLR